MRGKQHEEAHHWKGGRITRKGYVLLFMPEHPGADTKGYIPEHRHVMEQVHGRRLERTEHVHHINGDKGDNRPENLVVLTKLEHHRLHGGKELAKYHAEHPEARSANRKRPDH